MYSCCRIKGFQKEVCPSEKSFKSQWWLVSPPLLRMSRFSSLCSQCLLLDKTPFKLLSTCPSFYLPASDMYVYFPEWLHILFPANGLFAATGGSQDWLQRLSFWVYNASFRLREMLKKTCLFRECSVFFGLFWAWVFMEQVIPNNMESNHYAIWEAMQIKLVISWWFLLNIKWLTI